MGCYEDRVLPRLIDRALGERATGPVRDRVCAGLRGEVVEIGSGAGSTGWNPCRSASSAAAT